MTGTTNELFHRHGNNGGGRGKRKQHDKQAWDKPGSLHWTSNPPVNVVMSLFLSCRMTVRAPTAAVLATSSLISTPGRGGGSAACAVSRLLGVRLRGGARESNVS